MAVYTTEIASDKILSDNPIHQRLLRPYHVCRDLVHGRVLEIGCGEGRGIEILGDTGIRYTGVDKIEEVIATLAEKEPQFDFIAMSVPPLGDFEDNSFDVVLSFQVIEHIKDDKLFLEEIRRVLKPGGKAYITTPNIRMSLSRNPWHIREYTPEALSSLAASIFSKVEMKGIAGNEKVMAYYEQNKKSVEHIMKWDVLNLQYRLPAAILKIPYEILNRVNRNKLKTGNDSLVRDIVYSDYLVTDVPEGALDLFCILKA